MLSPFNATYNKSISLVLCNSEYLLWTPVQLQEGNWILSEAHIVSKGGRSIITTRSTAVNDTISRIVPRLEGPPVTTPRTDTHFG